MSSQERNEFTTSLDVDDGNSAASESQNKRNNPWPHLGKYFAFKHCQENVAIFSCVLCRPKEVIIKGHMSSLSNLKSHIRRKHNQQYNQFDETIKSGSRRGQHCFSCEKRSPLSNASLERLMHLKEMKERNHVSGFQEIERNPENPAGEVKSSNLQNCISFVSVDQIKTEEDDSVDTHDEPLQPFSHQQSSHLYPDTLENSFSTERKREKSVSPPVNQEPEQKKIKTSSDERTDCIISAINRLEKVLISETQKRQEDLFDVFGRNVSDQLRQLPRRQAIMAQSKIQNLLIQEFLEYDNVSPSKTEEQPP